MKRMLLLAFSLLLISSAALADHIGIYADVAGASCTITEGFNPTATIIHKFTVGARGSRFRVTVPTGSILVGFITPFTPVGGDINTDYELAYGQCFAGSIVLGTISAFLTPGIVAVAPPAGWTHVDAVSCSFAYVSATAGEAAVGNYHSICDGVVATEPSTWGSVKALYR